MAASFQCMTKFTTIKKKKGCNFWYYFHKCLDTLILENRSIRLYLFFNACLNSFYINNFIFWFSNTKYFSIISLLGLIKLWFVETEISTMLHVIACSPFISDKFCLNLYLFWELRKESRWILNVFNINTAERFLCNLFAHFLKISIYNHKCWLNLFSLKWILIIKLLLSHYSLCHPPNTRMKL